MRAVLDTNIFISGIFWESNFCSQIINKWKNRMFEMVSSMEIIEELIETLKCFRIQLDNEIIDAWGNLVIGNSILVESFDKLDVVKEDLNDNKFLEAGIAGKADFIISQDKHLLKLKEYQGIKIIEPKDFLIILEEK